MCADAGGGGTRECLANGIMKVERTCAMDAFLTTTYSHHGFNLMITSPFDKFFGDGAMQNRNMLHLLRTYYAIQKLCEMIKFRGTWNKETDMSYEEKFQEPPHAR